MSCCWAGRATTCPHAAGLDAALRLVLEGKAVLAPPSSPVELFDRLVRYRNREIGHGAAGMAATDDFYQRMGNALLAGTRRVAAPPGRAGRTPARLRVGGARGARQLAGGAPGAGGRRAAASEPLELAREQAALLPSGERLDLMEAGAAGTLTALHPLVVFDAEAGECCFLGPPGQGAGRVPVLQPAGGHWSVPTWATSSAQLLARALGLPAIGDEQAGTVGGASQADDPAGERPRGRRGEQLGEFELLERAGPRRHGRGLPRLAAVAGPAGGAEVPGPGRATPRPKPASAARSARWGRWSTRTWPRCSRPAREGEQWFYAMELVEGAPLSAVCDKLSSAGSSVTEVDLPAWQAALSTAVDEHAQAGEADQRRAGAGRAAAAGPSAGRGLAAGPAGRPRLPAPCRRVDAAGGRRGRRPCIGTASSTATSSRGTSWWTRRGSRRR